MALPEEYGHDNLPVPQMEYFDAAKILDARRNGAERPVSNFELTGQTPEGRPVYSRMVEVESGYVESATDPSRIVVAAPLARTPAPQTGRRSGRKSSQPQTSQTPLAGRLPAPSVGNKREISPRRKLVEAGVFALGIPTLVYCAAFQNSPVEMVHDTQSGAATIYHFGKAVVHAGAVVKGWL